MMIDYTSITYILLIIASLYNICLLSFWWYLTHREGVWVDIVYKLVLLMFITRFYSVCIGGYARYLRLTDENGIYYLFMSGWFWETRVLYEVVVIIILGIFITRRMIRSYLFNDPNYQSIIGRRRADKKNV